MNEKEIIEKLKNNWTALGGLSSEEVEVLKKYKVHVGLWHGYKLEHVGFNSINNNGLIYRIHPDFNQPDKKKCWFDTLTKQVVVKNNNGISVEVTEEYADYLSKKPEGDCELRMVKRGDELYGYEPRGWRVAAYNYHDEGPKDRGFRWCKVSRSEPLKRTVLFDYILAAVSALKIGIEYAEECLASHDATLGRTTRKNRITAEQIEYDINEMRRAAEQLTGERSEV